VPWVARIKREDPFRPEDSNELYAQCKRIAAAAEHFLPAGWREDSGCRLFYFTTWAKARALQHWIDRSGIAHRDAEARPLGRGKSRKRSVKR
jgi:hypothetical protein